MNKEMNEIIMNLLSDDDKEIYRNQINDIKMDYSNIRYLMLYSSSNEDNNVTTGIIQYLEEKYDVTSRDINELLLPKLIKYHTDNFDNQLKSTHESINMLEIYAEDVCMFVDTEDEPKYVDAFLAQVVDLAKKTNSFSDFIMNFCAIQYIRKKTPSKVLDKIDNKYKISFNYRNISTIMDIHTEFTNVFKKLTRLLLAYDNKEFNEEIKISLYDAKSVAEHFVEYGMNNVSKELLTWLINAACEYDPYNFMINSIAIYSSLWDSAMTTSKYKLSLDYYIKEFYYHLSIPIKDVFNNDRNVYKDLIEQYESCRQVLDDSEDLFSKKNIDSLYKFFEKNICKYSYDAFKAWYAKTLGDINKVVNM